MSTFVGKRGLPFLLAALLALMGWTGPGTVQAVEAPPSSEPITARLGIVQSLTGPGGPFGASATRGMELAIQEINEDGTVPGVRLDYHVVDDQSSADASRAAFAEFVDEGVTALVGPTLSTLAPAGHQLAQEASIPVVSATTSGPGITETGDYVFRVALGEDVMAPAAIAYVAERQALDRAVLIVDSGAAHPSEDAMRQGLSEVGGSLLAEIDVAETDVVAALAIPKGEEPDAFLVTPLLDSSAAVLRALRDAGFEQVVIGGNSFNSPEIAQLAGDAVEGAYVGAAWNPGVPAPRSQRFVQAYTDAYGHTPDQFAAQGYTSIYLLADAVQRAGSTQPAAVRDALAATQELETPLGTPSMSERREAVHEPVIQQYRQGVLTVVEAEAEPAFTLASIQGSYAVSFMVAIPGPTSVDFLGGTGVFHADGNGHLSGTESYNATRDGGYSCIDVSVTGTYSVNPDGTGTTHLTLSSPDPRCSTSFSQAIVLARAGDVVKVANIQPGTVLIGGEWTRQ